MINNYIQVDYYKCATIGDSLMINFTPNFKRVTLPYSYTIVKV